MSILRSLGKFLGGFLFTTFLIGFISNLAFIQLTEYDSLKPVFTDVLSVQLSATLSEEELSQLHTALLLQCANVNEIELPLGTQKTSVKCSDIRSSTASDLPKLVSNKLFDDMYFKKYSCGFINCILQSGEEKFTVLISENANSFLKGIQNYLLAGMVVFGLVFLVSTETWVGRLRNIGMSLIVVAVPFLVFKFVFGYLKDLLMPKQIMDLLSYQANAAINNIINSITVSLSNNSLIILIVGMVLTASGYILAYRGKISKKKKS